MGVVYRSKTEAAVAEKAQYQWSSLKKVKSEVLKEKIASRLEEEISDYYLIFWSN